MGPSQLAAALIPPSRDASFLTILAHMCLARDRRGSQTGAMLPVALMLSLLAMAGLLHHLEAAGYGEPAWQSAWHWGRDHASSDPDRRPLSSPQLHPQLAGAPRAWAAAARKLWGFWDKAAPKS